MATEVEQLYLQLELISIEEQMLKLQMLKQATEKTRLNNQWCEFHWCEFTTWMNKCTLDHFECLRRIQPLRPEKVTAGNYVLSGPITALTARVYTTCS